MFSKTTIINSPDDILNLTNKDKKYFVFASEKFDFKKLNTVFKSFWMGAVFPMVFFKTSLYDDKAILCELSEDTQMDIYDENCDELLSTYASYMVIVDGLDKYMNNKLEDIFSNSSENTVIFGGGAGRSDMNQKGCIFNGESFTQNEIITLKTQKLFSIGANHGYKSDNNFSILTAVNQNIIEKINGKSAFLFYQDYVKENFDIILDKNNVFSTGLKHPFIFECSNAENLVRVPAQTDGESLFMVGEVYQDSIVSIGTVSDTDLLNAAKKSITIAKKNSEYIPHFCIVFTCLGREQYSFKNFMEELKTIDDSCKDIDMIGALSLGEIANTSEQNLEFYNSTCVVGVE